MGDPGGLRDLIDRHLLVVPVAEHLERGGEQLRASLLGSLRCQRASGDASAWFGVDFVDPQPALMKSRLADTLE